MPRPRCHLCRRELPSVYDTTPDGLRWCRNTIECNYRARRRLHVPRDEALKLRALERAAGTGATVLVVPHVAKPAEHDTTPTRCDDSPFGASDVRCLLPPDHEGDHRAGAFWWKERAR